MSADVTRVYRLLLMACVVVCVWAGMLLIGSASASAALFYSFDGEFAVGPSFNPPEPNGIAVNGPAGLAYIATAGSVDVLEISSETQVAGLDGGLTPAGSFGEAAVAVAVNDASGAVYVLDTEHGVVDEFDSAGSYVCQITGAVVPSASECNGVTGSETPAHGLNAPRGIAVDQATGELYVGDANDGVVDVFSAGGAFLRQVSLAPVAGELSASEAHGIAVDDQNGDVYVSNVEPAVVYVFNATGEYQVTWNGSNTPAGSFGAPGFLAVASDNVSGRVYVTDTNQSVAYVFTPSGEFLHSSFERPLLAPQAGTIDQTTGKFYVANVVNEKRVLNVFGPPVLIPDVTTSAATETKPASATLNGSVNSDEVQVINCEFEYGTSTSYGQTAECVPAAASIEPDSSTHSVSANLTGLDPGVTYHFRLVAANGNKVRSFGEDLTFSTPPRPSITGAVAKSVTSSSAELGARVNPNGLDTTYHFEWGTSTAYGTSVPAPDVDLGSGNSGVFVSAQLTGLSPNVTYHWRVLATSEAGTTVGVDHTFIYDQSGRGLPDGRAYEMITPTQKNAALIGDVTFGVPPEISEDGSRLILGAVQCFAGATSCPSVRPAGNGSPYSFDRTPDGWVTTPLAPPATQFEANGWMLFNADLGTSLFSIRPAHGVDDFFERKPDGSFVNIGPLTPDPNLLESISSSSMAATADLSHVIYTDAGHAVWPFDASRNGSVYEYSGVGNVQPRLVSVEGGPGSSTLISTCGAELGGSVNGQPFGAVSADGRTVYFATQGHSGGTVACPAELSAPAVREIFARIDNDGANARTVAISQPSAGSPVPPNESCTTVACIENTSNSARFRDAQFVGAGSDGSKIFFTDTQQLTDDASEDLNVNDQSNSPVACSTTTGANGCNLYMYDSPQELPLSGKGLVDVSAGDVSGGGPQVRGVMALSSDGSHVYFVAGGVLTATANNVGQVAQTGQNNLYMYEHDASHPSGHLAFVATLSAVDEGEWKLGLGRPANVTPDGKVLVFTSGAAITPDVTRTDDAQQVFSYNAETEELQRISIGDNGFNDNGNGGVGGASIAPGRRGYTRLGAGRSDPTMSHDGSYIFFMSSVGLTPGALNGVPIGVNINGTPAYAENIYEYHAGHIELISDGHDSSSEPSELCESASAVCLVGSDATGENVFFATVEQLVPSDTDTQIDFYDARVCTAADPCITPPPSQQSSCLGEACHGTPAPTPSLLPLSSMNFSGLGNLAAKPKPPAPSLTNAQKLAKALKACRAKHNKRKRASCEASARKKYGSKHKAKKSRKAKGTNRRGK